MEKNNAKSKIENHRNRVFFKEKKMRKQKMKRKWVCIAAMVVFCVPVSSGEAFKVKFLICVCAKLSQVVRNHPSEG